MSLYIYKDLRLMILGLMSHVTIITWMAGYLLPSPRYDFRFEAVSRLWDLNLTLSV